ncbi:MAG: HupE/UreJ family protein [Pseudomonadota bacterium]
MRRSLCVLILLLPALARADIFLQGEVELVAGEYGQYELLVKAPTASVTSGAIALPEDCQTTREQTYTAGQQALMTIGFQCARHLGEGDALSLPLSLDAVLLITRGADGATQRVLTGADPVVFDVAAPTTLDRTWSMAARDYFGQGLAHIAEGWDHLAFVLCLCLLIRRFSTLLWMITAFTVGHSVSMALSFLDVISVPMAPTEAVIALSIVWMAREALLPTEADDERVSRQHAAVIGAFGLLHGLGFASALQSLGVIASERLIALAFFNLGVEAGQVIFVVLVCGLIALIRQPVARRLLSTSTLMLIGGVGSFWTLQRLLTLT